MDHWVLCFYPKLWKQGPWWDIIDWWTCYNAEVDLYLWLKFNNLKFSSIDSRFQPNCIVTYLEIPKSKTKKYSFCLIVTLKMTSRSWCWHLRVKPYLVSRCLIHITLAPLVVFYNVRLPLTNIITTCTWLFISRAKLLPLNTY